MNDSNKNHGLTHPFVLIFGAIVIFAAGYMFGRWLHG